MHLLAPWWWLLFPPLGGALIILYLLKLRRRDYVVPSTMLWEQALQDLQANAPLQKLRTHLLLLLQLLILLCVIAALSRPALRVSRVGGQRVVLILDASASMQCTDVAPSRFEVARQRAHDAVEALGPADRMMLVSIGGATRALTPFTTDKRALHEALDRVQVTDCRADLRSALELAAGLTAGPAGVGAPSVEVLSDGAVPPVSLPTGFDAPLHFTPIGAHGDNVGIVMMDARRRLSAKGGFEGIIGLQNFGGAERRGTLEISLNGQLRDAHEVRIPAGGQHTEVLDDLPAEGGLIGAHLDLQDALAADNTAQVLLPAAAPVQVALVTPGNVFLKAALALDPTITVTEYAATPATLAPGTILVADTVAPGTLPPGIHALLIGAETLGSAPATVRATASRPVVATWDRRHPVLADVDLTDLHIATAAVLQPAANARPLIESEAGPIALVSEASGQRVIALGWDLHQSDLGLRAAFPIFIGNCIDWLSGQQQRGQELNARTGQVLQLAVPPEVGALTLIPPDGAPRPVTAADGLLTVSDLSRAGVYRVTAPRQPDQQFAVNLADAGESNVAPQAQLTVEGASGKVPVQTGPVPTDREFWRLCLLCALGILCVEWWVFHRRIG